MALAEQNLKERKQKSIHKIGQENRTKGKLIFQQIILSRVYYKVSFFLNYLKGDVTQATDPLLPTNPLALFKFLTIVPIMQKDLV